jgi:hypothetical protein
MVYRVEEPERVGRPEDGEAVQDGCTIEGTERLRRFDGHDRGVNVSCKSVKSPTSKIGQVEEASNS